MSPTRTNLSLVSGFALATLAKAIGFATTIMLASQLGAAGFGEYGAVLGTLSLFGIAAQASLGAAASNLLARDRAVSPPAFAQTASTILAMVVALATVAAVALAVSAPFIASSVFRSASMTPLLIASAPVLALLAVQSVVDGTLAGTHRFRARNLLPLVQAATMLPIAYVVAPTGPIGAVIAYGVSSAVAIAFGAWILLRKEIPLSAFSIATVSKQSIVRITRFCAPLILNNVLVIVGNSIITAALTWSSGGFVELGHFTFAGQLRLLVLMAPFLVHATFAPLLSAAHRDSVGDVFRSREQEILQLTVWCAWGAGAVTALLAPLLVHVVGRDFGDASLLIGLNAALAIIMAISNCAGVVLVATGRERKTILPNTTLFLLVLLVAGPSAVAGGSFWATIALCLAQLVQLLMLSYAWQGRILSRPLTLGLLGAGSTTGISAIVATDSGVIAVLVLAISVFICVRLVGFPKIVLTILTAVRATMRRA